MPKRFSEADAQRIFALAAERQHESGQEEPGLSLEELEEVGRAAGLDPAIVREAAMDALRPEATSTTRRVLGMPLEFRRERFIRGAVTDEAWAQIVVDLRRQFNKTGLVTDIGPLREWRSEANDQRQPVTVTLSPEREGTRVVIEQAQAQTALGLGIGLATNLLMGLMFLVFATVETGEPDLIFPATILLTFAAVFGFGAFFGMRGYSRRQLEKFDATLDRIDLAVRDAERPAAPASVEASTEAPRLDPALLDDLPRLGAEADGTGRSRVRE
ncbi:MAG: hypothetical protein AAF791_01640 [Bacteroidota bacterium]